MEEPTSSDLQKVAELNSLLEVARNETKISS
jgi:hypothetical protein